MRLIIVSAVAALATLAPVEASAQLVTERVNGLHRICTYRSGPLSLQLREYEVGIGESCPASYPVMDNDRDAPPTARLEATETTRGIRYCTYVQGAGRWTYRLPTSAMCPLNAGLAAAGEGVQVRD